MSAELLYQRLYIFRGAKPVGHVVREEAITPTDSLMGDEGGEKTKNIQEIKSCFLKVMKTLNL